MKTKEELEKENKKVLELNDKELKQVSGGIGYTISSVDAGDVFIHKSSSTVGYVVTAQRDIPQNGIYIPCRCISFHNNKWVVGMAIDVTSRSLITNFSYSAELTGTISY